MRVFDFTLLSGYEFSGVDVAQGFRARLFAKNNVNAKFIFTELPTIRDMELYGSQKIKRGQIMSAHLFMTGRLDMSLSVKKEALLENEKENYEYDNIDEDGKVIRLYNSGEKSVEILCDEDGFVINESLFKNGKKYLENYYTDSLSYTELYNWDNDSNDGLNLGRRIFWNKQGQMVYEQCIYILARGTGSLNIISLHDRHSRRGHGFFLPGGERLVSSKGEEVFVYFEKGDMKPPLAVYFSGYRTQEGFEGYYMMRGFGCPFILVTDPRSEGGAFYLGDSEFEQMITDYVTDKLDELGLTKDELVLSGASMGTFGSLYYGSKLSPHALLLAKPLANMGNVARNERILRAGGFATSLDILMKNYDNLSDEAIEQLNNRMWDRFDSADWSQTKFIISYLYEDDYDPDGYPSILSHLKSSGVEVYGKGSHGRHTDNSSNVMAWFKSQYNNLLHDDFSR